MNRRTAKLLTGTIGAGLVASLVLLKPTQEKPYRETVLPMSYPAATTNLSYSWSLESSTNPLRDWVTVTNYPFGYTNDVTVTNDGSPMKFFRMHGRL